MPKIRTISSIEGTTDCGCGDSKEPTLREEGLGTVQQRWAWKCPKGMKQVGMKLPDLKQHCKRVRVMARPRRRSAEPSE